MGVSGQLQVKSPTISPYMTLNPGPAPSHSNHCKITTSSSPFWVLLHNLKPKASLRPLRMADHHFQLLRGFELRLLRCTLSPPLSTSSSHSSHDQTQYSSPICTYINTLLNSVESGDYLHVLHSEPARLLFPSLNFDILDSAECADRFYSELLLRVETFLLNDSKSEFDKACNVVLVMCLAIAALFWFTQSNMTGSVLFSSKAPNIEYKYN